MLIVERYTFHRHSSNPKTGRTNWRCSRRRVKDIRCPSSCHSVDDTTSIPSAHDPNCAPLSNSELTTYRIRAEKYSNQLQLKLNTPADDNIDLNDSCDFNNYNTDSFQNREVDSDEEELNVVLNDFENVINDGANTTTDNNTSGNVQDIDENNSHIIDQLSQHSALNSDDNQGESEHNTNVNGDDVRDEESVNSEMYQANEEDFTEPSNTISGIIESNKKLLDHIKSKMNTFMESQGSQQQPQQRLQNSNQSSSSSSSTSSTMLSNSISIPKLNSINANHSIYFVTSKVGHPMLVVDSYTFHKHSTNPKTNRINWRCARRRVKDIRCSSSCYTVDGVVSTPTSHDAKCSPLTDEMLRVYQNKRAKVSTPNSGSFNQSTINTKADSFTTLKNKVNLSNGNEADFNGYNNNRYSMPIYQMYRNKRKENQPTRSNDNTSEDMKLFNKSSSSSSQMENTGCQNESYANFEEEEEKDLYYENDVDSEDYDLGDGSMKTNDELLDNCEFGMTENDIPGEVEDEEMMTGAENSAAGQDICADIEVTDLDECDLSYSSQNMSNLISELKKMRQKELVYAERIKK